MPLELAAGATGEKVGFLDRFASKMESIATDVERSMTHMQKKLEDKVQVSAFEWSGGG